MTREKRTKLIKHLKYNRSIGADYLITDEDADEIIKALEQEPYIQEKQANADKIDAVYIDGFKAGYAQARFDYKQEPCDDAISRILTRMWNCRGKHTTSIDKVKMEQIIREELPSVTQKSGKWIKGKCSICGEHAPFWSMATTYYESNYCPNCGAKMV